MQSKKTVVLSTLEDSLSIIDDAIDASDAERKRRETQEQQRNYQEVKLGSFADFAMAYSWGGTPQRRSRGVPRRPSPYPMTDCYICYGQDPNCPHRMRNR